MARARLVQLPVIPIGIVLLFYEFGAVLTASGAPLSDPPMAQSVVNSAIHRLTDGRVRKGSTVVLLGDRAAAVPDKLILLAAEDVTKPPAAASADREPSKSTSRSSSTVPVERPAERKIQPNQSPSILQMLEGSERLVLIGAAIAVAFFFLGWIGGGNYYVRRERRRRTKLRF